VRMLPDDASKLPAGALQKNEVLDTPEHNSNPKDLERTLTTAKASEAWLLQIVGAIPALVWCNLPDGRNGFSNQRWQDYTGITSEEARGWGWLAVASCSSS
jgi:PAS domain-containing protein